MVLWFFMESFVFEQQNLYKVEEIARSAAWLTFSSLQQIVTKLSINGQ